jgi:predicted dehydrogenase
MVNVGVIGVGYWGPNLVRNLASLEGVTVAALCDTNAASATRTARKFCPAARVVQEYSELARDPQIDAVVIATPIQTHFDLGSLFLTEGKHVFIEKPLARTVEECQTLIDLAKKHHRVLMVGHVFEYNAAVQTIKEYLDRGELGKLFYIYSQRVNLGRIQMDVNALWSFAPHDVSIINYWLNDEPVRVSTKGFSYLTRGIEDVVFVTIEYKSGVGAHLHLGWLDPRKIRLMTLVGSKKMLVYDDVSVDSRIQLYDKGIAGLDEFVQGPESFAQFQFQIRTGDLVIPRIKFGEPLQTECRHFIDCILNNAKPMSDGKNGMRVVKVLQAAERSLKTEGSWVEL